MKSNNLNELTKLIRYDIVTSTTAAGSGHPTSSLSAVELMTVLHFDGHFHYNYEDPKYIYNDRLVFSKGHASPLYYAQFHAAGQLKYEELLTLRKFDSVLEGHPTPRFKFVDVSTGSLGQGLSVGLGMALGIKYYKKAMNAYPEREPMVWVLLGDSEVAEGQVWEAMEVAAFHKVNNSRNS
jgi:transketolase